jgi:5-methylcytosine-specific restriction endonuclease McrA
VIGRLHDLHRYRNYPKRTLILKTRLFNSSQRTALFLYAGGKCSLCGSALAKGWHADHRKPFCRGGATDTLNGQALCRTCNLKKGDHDESSERE